MSEIKDGGRAFPKPCDECSHGEGVHAEFGMSIRDYFIAHAPAEPWFFFKPTMPSARPEPIFAPDDGWKEVALNDKVIEEWDRERERQRFYQWPCFWADIMLAMRAK